MRCGNLSIICAILLGCGARTDMGDPDGDASWVDDGEAGAEANPSDLGGSGGVRATDPGSTWVAVGGAPVPSMGGSVPFHSLGGSTWLPLGGTTWRFAAGGRRANGGTWARGGQPSYGGSNSWTTRRGRTSYGGSTWTVRGGSTSYGGRSSRPRGGATAKGGSYPGGSSGAGGYVAGGSYAWGGATAIGGRSSALGGYGNLVVQVCVSAAQNACQKCQCTECASQAAECFVDAGCMELVQCAAQNGCTGLDCFLVGACSATLTKLGGLQSLSVQKGINMALCTVTMDSRCGC